MFKKLQKKAESKNLKIYYINERIEHDREVIKGKKQYSLWDTYVMADFISYPSLLEGWGNQFIEAVIAKKPVLIYEYPVFSTDIKPYGFQVVSLGDTHELDNNNLAVVSSQKNRKAIQEIVEILTSSANYGKIIEKNYQIGSNHFSYSNIILL